MGTTPDLRDDHIERLLTPDDVSTMLGIPTKTLANWRCERTGPLPLKIGCHVRYRAADLTEWIEQCAADARRRMAS